ncbi:hypothetical protein C8A00DRAFT_36446 [Chaetomidium leptoderma]|uniref:Uncharacterized protein n=1 Tax=Chaetomidium leptoderma TaxID=669021 RepID=A0AAN6VGA3_9PEZI|nr:hypothetical protein C8A00DRAFT_36446 [Chaetomidium leptoderma]
MSPEEKELYYLEQQFPKSVQRYVAWNRYWNTPMNDYHDPFEIVPHLERSKTDIGRSEHRVWRETRTSIDAIAKWKQGHATWKQALAANNDKIPAIGSSALGSKVVTLFNTADLVWFVDGGAPSLFWAGAPLDDKQWRTKHMNLEEDLNKGVSLNEDMLRRLPDLMKIAFKKWQERLAKAGETPRWSEAGKPRRPIFFKSVNTPNAQANTAGQARSQKPTPGTSSNNADRLGKSDR